MQAIQPKPMPGAPIWPLSVEAYRALGEAGLMPKNTELLYGIVYTKMSKSPLHSFLVTRLLRLLQACLPADCILRCEQPITCSDSEPEPDLSLVQGSEEDFRNRHPSSAELVVEVCVSSHEYDRSKLQAYATAGVKEVWLVLVPERQVEVYRRPTAGDFTSRATSGAKGTLACKERPSIAVSLDTLFAK